jgi:hypothetical protein
MTDFDPAAPLPDLSGWVGTTRTRAERLAPWPARALAATLDRDPDVFGEGAVLPHGWHWMYFHDAARASGVGLDGHEARVRSSPQSLSPAGCGPEAGSASRCPAQARRGGRADVGGGADHPEDGAVRYPGLREGPPHRGRP